jgi:hypothetical protein
MQKMENFLREGVDLQGISGRVAGDAHFFEDATSPAKVRAYLDSIKVCWSELFVVSVSNLFSLRAHIKE